MTEGGDGEDGKKKRGVSFPRKRESMNSGSPFVDGDDREGVDPRSLAGMTEGRCRGMTKKTRG